VNYKVQAVEIAGKLVKGRI